jgi:hypothetical protein
VSRPANLVILDRGTPEEREAIQAQIKKSGTAWWHHFQDVWIVKGGDPCGVEGSAQADDRQGDALGSVGLRLARRPSALGVLRPKPRKAENKVAERELPAMRVSRHVPNRVPNGDPPTLTERNSEQLIVPETPEPPGT